jgi:glycosyltransferase involved in cell wall biosynthesis
MSEPLLTVCLITYNCANHIRETIDSVIMQQVSASWELLIADDFSTDGTREIILNYKKKYPDFIKLILQE